VPITVWDEALLQSGLYTVRPTLQLVEPITGALFDVTDHLTGFDITATMASPSIDVGFQLARGGTGLELGAVQSLSPYLDQSTYTFPVTARPAIDPVVEFFLYVSIDTAFDNTQQGLLMQGVIDSADVAPGGGLITLTARDRSARYQDVQIEGTKQYGMAGGREASLVMGDMLTDAGFSPAELVVLAPADFMVEPYPVGGVSVLEAMRTLAQSAGRDVRCFSQGGQWNLTYYEPDRARGLYDLLVIPQATIKLEELSWGIADVRNSLDVWYPDPTTGLPVGPIHSEDVDSIARYGRRHFVVYLNRIENIRDTPHAQAFADAAIADQKDPFVSHKILMPFNPSILLNDQHLYSGRWAENTVDLLLAVMAYQHTWRAAQKGGDGVARTTVSASGKPRAALRDYRKSTPPKVIVTTAAPTTEYAPEGTLVFVTDSIAFPV
jgi:hypothetical protein